MIKNRDEDGVGVYLTANNEIQQLYIDIMRVCVYTNRIYYMLKTHYRRASGMWVCGARFLQRPREDTSSCDNTRLPNLYIGIDTKPNSDTYNII